MYGNSIKVFIILLMVFILIFSAGYVSAQIVKEGLVSYWPIDRKFMDGKKVKDLQGANHGETSGEPEIVDGIVGQAIKIDNKSDCILVADSQSLDITKGITVEAWIKPIALTIQYPGLVCKWDWGANSRSYALYLYAFKRPWFMISDTGAYIGGNYDCISTTELVADEWYHFAGVYDGSKLMLYVNLVKVCETDLKTAIFKGSAGLSIGASTNGGAIASDEIFNGLIDEVRIYDRPLTEPEIERNFESRELAAVKPAGKLSLTWGRIKL